MTEVLPPKADTVLVQSFLSLFLSLFRHSTPDHFITVSVEAMPHSFQNNITPEQQNFSNLFSNIEIVQYCIANCFILIDPSACDHLRRTENSNIFFSLWEEYSDCVLHQFERTLIFYTKIMKVDWTLLKAHTLHLHTMFTYTVRRVTLYSLLH